MPLQIVRNGVNKMKADATSMLPIHRFSAVVGLTVAYHIFENRPDGVIKIAITE